jgi:hypothetical protein
MLLDSAIPAGRTFGDQDELKLGFELSILSRLKDWMMGELVGARSDSRNRQHRTSNRVLNPSNPILQTSASAIINRFTRMFCL